LDCCSKSRLFHCLCNQVSPYQLKICLTITNRLIILFDVDEKGDYPSDRTFITFYILWSLIVLLGGINAVISALIYKVERQQRGEFVGDTKVKLQLTKTNDILSILLPKFIKEKISRLGSISF